MGTNPVGTWLETDEATQNASAYKAQIDANFAVIQRIAAMFAPQPLATPTLSITLQPGALFSGSALTEVGSYTTGTFSASSTSVAVASAAGISNGMVCTGAGIPNNTTVTISGTTVTLSNSTTAAGTNAPLIFMQLTGAITAPGGSNNRIDRVVVNASTGLVSVVTGTATVGTPSAPAVPAGCLPVATLGSVAAPLTASTTSLTGATIHDERCLGMLGPLAALSSPQTFSGGQAAAITPLTSVSNSIAINLALSNNFSHSFTQNTTLANPSNITPGQSGSIFFTQNASTPYTLAFGSYWKFPGGTVPPVSTALGAEDTLYYNVRDTTHVEGVLVRANA